MPSRVQSGASARGAPPPAALGLEIRPARWPTRGATRHHRPTFADRKGSLQPGRSSPVIARPRGWALRRSVRHLSARPDGRGGSSSPPPARRSAASRRIGAAMRSGVATVRRRRSVRRAATSRSAPRVFSPARSPAAPPARGGFGSRQGTALAAPARPGALAARPCARARRRSAPCRADGHRAPLRLGVSARPVGGAVSRVEASPALTAVRGLRLLVRRSVGRPKTPWRTRISCSRAVA